MSMRLTQVALAGLFLTLGVRDAAAEVMRWQIDGETREAIVYVPASPGGEGVPLVLSFHGYGDNMQNFQYTNVHVAWPDAIVVYFQGLETRGGLPGWQVERGGGNRDLKLVDVALRSLRETYKIDDDLIYATGFSNGGMFTYLLWAERPGVFAAYAPVAARLRPSVRPTQAKPVFHVAGERDRVVRFADQEAAIAVAIAVNGVDATTHCGAGCTEYGAGTAAPVMTWIHAGAHVYPRGTSERIVSFLPRTLPFALIVADSDRIDSTTRFGRATGEVPAPSPTWHARIFGALPSRCGPFGWAGSAGSVERQTENLAFCITQADAAFAEV